MAFFPPGGQVVLFGGMTDQWDDGPAVSAETWSFNGRSWQQLHPLNSPPARYAASLVYDSTNQVLVLFGGTSDNKWWPQGGPISSLTGFTDTWEWDGTNWKEMSPRESPPAFAFSTMTYDSKRKAAILYAGGSMTCRCQAPDQTWSWDGSNWTQVPTSTVPDPTPGGVAGTVTYDAASSQTLFIGSSGTWTLGAGGWLRLVGGGPTMGSDRVGAIDFGVAYDATRGALLVLGSNSDTWAWDGKAWTAQNPAAAPPVRIGGAFAYDPIDKAVVLFGGASPYTGYRSGYGNLMWATLDDTWAWDGAAWKQVGGSGLPTTPRGARS